MDTSRPEEAERRLIGFRYTSRPERGAFTPHGPSGEPAEEDPDEKNTGESSPGESGSGGESKKENSSSLEEGSDSSEEVSSWEDICTLYEEGEKQKGRQESAIRILQNRSSLTPKGTGELWVWDPDAGVYREEGREVLEQLLADKLGAHHSTHEVRQVLAKVKALVPTGRLGETGVIPLESTDLLVDVYSTGEVSSWSREPDPERLIGARAQVPWRTGVNRAALEEHLRQAVPSGEDRQVIQDYAGYSLLHWARPFRRALVLVGPGRPARGHGRTPAQTQSDRPKKVLDLGSQAATRLPRIR
jgi:hypothetical protein